MFGVKINPGLGDGLPGPLEGGFRLAPPFSALEGAIDGAGGVVDDSACFSSPILLGDLLGTGGGGGGGGGSAAFGCNDGLLPCCCNDCCF